MHVFEYALDVGSQLLNSQTGWVHWNIEKSVGGMDCMTIPLLDNFMYSLALFRTNSLEKVFQARDRMERLLAFHVAGNFPIYLHEYPICQDPLQGLKVAAILYFLLKNQSVHLGEKLTEKVEEVLQQCIERASTSRETRLPFWAQQRLHILTGAGPAVYFQARWPLELDYLLINKILAGESLDSLLKNWNSTLCCHSYPLLRRFQFGCTQMTQFYDLFCSLWIDGCVSQRLQVCHAAYLCLAFAPEQDAALLPVACASKEVQEVYIPEGELPFTLFFGDRDDLHSFVLAAKHLKVVMIEQGANKFLLEIQFPEEIPNQGDGGLEVNFFVSQSPQIQILVNSEKASMFSLDDEVTILSSKQAIQIKFPTPLVGLCGHIYPGNRPSQLATTGKKHFAAFDTLIGLRSFKRSLKCTLIVEITCHPVLDFCEQSVSLFEESSLGSH